MTKKTEIEWTEGPWPIHEHSVRLTLGDPDPETGIPAGCICRHMRDRWRINLRAGLSRNHLIEHQRKWWCPLHEEQEYMECCEDEKPLFVQSGRETDGTHASRDEVTVCKTCGQIRVWGSANGEAFTVEFYLRSEEQLIAATAALERARVPSGTREAE